MNIKQSLYKNDTKVSRLYKDGCLSLASIGSDPAFSSLDDFASINKYWKYKISEDSEIVSSLDDAVKDYAYLTSAKKWYAKNTSGFYEEYGIYENVDNLDPYHSESRLPEGYTEVEYLSGNNAIINTGFIPTVNTRLVMKARVTSDTPQYPRFAGCGMYNTVDGWQFDREKGYLCVKYLGDTAWITTTTTLTTGTTYTLDYNKDKFYLDETLVASGSPSGSTDQPLYLFGYWRTSDSTWSAVDKERLLGDMFYAKIYEDDVLVRDLVPCRNSANVYGMYDLVNNVFYTNCAESTYSFSGGPDVSTHTGVSCYTGKLVVLSTDSHEYKWNGTEWIDLGEMNAIPVGWINFNANTIFDTGFNVIENYNINKFLRVRHTANVTTNYLYGGGQSGNWFSVEYQSSYGGSGYWNVGSSTIIYFNSSLKKWYTTTDGWSQLTVNGSSLAGLDSDGHSGSSSWSGILPNKTIKLCTNDQDGLKSVSVGTLYNFKLWNADDNLVHDFYGSYNNGQCCLYDDVTKEYIYNSFTARTSEPTFTQTGTLGDVPEYYPERTTPATSVTETSYHNLLGDNYYNGQTVAVYKNNYKVIDGKMEEVPAYIKITNVHGSWVDNTTKSKTGYNIIQSNGSYHVASAYDLIKITFFGIPDMKVLYGSYAESSYDFTVLGKIDVDCSSWTTSYSNQYADSKGQQSADAPNLTADYTNDGGEHFFYALYKKDASGDSNDDRGYIGLPNTVNIIWE